jgi:hypothetical protein
VRTAPALRRLVASFDRATVLVAGVIVVCGRGAGAAVAGTAPPESPA